MKKIFSLLFFLIPVSLIQAQHQVQFILNEQTAIRHDSVYITGTFNNWDSLGSKDYLMKPLGGTKKTITLNLPEGPLKYKFHRGSWLKVEKLYLNYEVADREVYISRDTVFMDSVLAWRDEAIEDKKVALAARPNDSLAIHILASIASIYAFSIENYSIDSAFHYAQKAIDLQQNSADDEITNSQDLLMQSLLLKDVVASLLHSLGNYPKALEIKLENVRQAEEVQHNSAMTYVLLSLTEEYVAMEDYENSLLYSKRAEKFLRLIDSDKPEKTQFTGMFLRRISEAYYNLGILDSAFIYAVEWESLVNKTGDPVPVAYNNLLLGDIYRAKGDMDAALDRYKQITEKAPNWLNSIIARSKVGTAKIYQTQNQFGLALKYALEALHFYQNNRVEVQSWGENTDTYIAEVSPLVADLYMKTGKPDSAYHFLQLSITLKDSLYNTDRIRQFQTLSFNETVRRQQLEQQKKDARQQFEARLKIFGLIAFLIAALIFAIVQIRNNRQKQRANNLLKEQKKALEQTLAELKATQNQLIQSEKLASLGQLTAGIAHEIKNPLNFVNNFSEVSKELLEELRQEMKEGNWTEVEALAGDLEGNLTKIYEHGHRADGIVQSMLLHSRGGSGEPKPTDLSAFVKEYVNLAYHGMRAGKDPINVSIDLDMDEKAGEVLLLIEDFSRVILNLCNNAFDAMRSKWQERDGYQPRLSIRTQRLDKEIQIEVTDNGPGIPENIRDKVLQPFFTTKKGTAGTGLGLSITNDIVKAHRGEINIHSTMGEQTTFIITLPIQSK